MNARRLLWGKIAMVALLAGGACAQKERTPEPRVIQQREVMGTGELTIIPPGGETLESTPRSNQLGSPALEGAEQISEAGGKEPCICE